MLNNFIENLKDLNILDDGTITMNDVKRMLSKAHALRKLRSIIGEQASTLSDDDLLSDRLTVGGKREPIDRFIKDNYTSYFTSVDESVATVVYHILGTYLMGRVVEVKDIPKEHLPILKARSVYRTHIIRTNISADTIAYFVGSRHLVIINTLRGIANIFTLNGIIERAINGSDISKYRNILPHAMFFSGDAVDTVRHSGCWVQHIGEGEIVLKHEAEQSTGADSESLTEQGWCSLMKAYGVEVKSIRPNYYASANI